MANKGLDILNAAKKQKLNNAQPAVAKQPKSPIMEKLTNVSIDDLNSMYFGNDDLTEGVDYTLYPNGEQRPVYDPHEEMKSLQNGTKITNVNSKMPSQILESIMQNPLDMPTEGMEIEESIMDSTLQNKTLDIINKLENRDGKEKTSVSPTQPKAQINESISIHQPSGDNIAQLIESIIDKKLKQYAGAIINETRKHGENANTLKFMKLGENFTFMDDANNVYEGKLIYKGKGKVKSK